MIMTREPSVYERVLKVTTDYLGPTAERLTTRQIRVHLGKRPNELTKDDIVKLVDWLKVSISLLTDDSKMVDDFTSDLLAIAKPNEKP